MGMAEAHDRDYADLERIRALVGAINEFYVSSPPPRGVTPETLVSLADSAAELEQLAAHIVRSWN